MKIYNKIGEVLLDVQVDDSSYRYRAIMGDNNVTLYYSLDYHFDIPVGSYIEFQGERYTLWRPENFKKKGTRNFEYTVVFGNSQEVLKKYKYKDLSSKPYRLKFTYTSTPAGFIRLLVDVLNIYESGWKVGKCIEASEKYLSFNHEYCYDVLGRLASEFETEWEIVDKTINLCKVERFKESPVSLSYGKGNGFKTGVVRENQGDKPPVTVLYVQGGERNIDRSKYGSPTLLLPKSQVLTYEGRHYRTDADGMYIIRADKPLTTIQEDSYDASNVYPSRVGTVTEVIEVDTEKNFYDFIDNTIPEELDFSKCRIDGEKATIIFQSGLVATQEFDIEQTENQLTGYIHSERRFKLVPLEIDGTTLPNKSLKPAVGDRYAIFNISLPEAYICNDSDKSGASWDMFRESVKYLYEREDEQFSFKGDLDGIYARKKWLEIGGKLVPGGYVDFSDTQFKPDGILIRITGVRDYINNPYYPQLELSNTPVAGYVSSELGKIDANEVIDEGHHKDALQFTKRRFRDAMETMSMLEDAFLNFSSSIDPITVRTMQLLVGDESLQFRFVTSKTSPVVISYNITYDAKKKILKAPVTILQHMTLGIDNITSSHKPKDYKFWDMGEYNSPPLTDPAKKYYMYAKVSKENGFGAFLLSETAIKLEDIAGYYHLLVGILNSEYEGERSFVELYGFTEILPGRVTTDRIVSPDGITYFDLVNSEIGGKIKFATGSSGLENLEEWTEVSKDISNANDAANKANDAVTDLNKYVDGAFSDGIITEAEAKAIEKYINIVKSTKSSVEATYMILSTNGYLTGIPRGNLINAKVSFFGAIDDLLRAINNAIADGKTTIAEKQKVDAKYAEFNSAYADFNDAVESAYKAIQNKLREYAQNYADEVSLTSKDNMAKNLGYTNYAALEEAAIKGQTLISGGKINTMLIEAAAIVTSQLLANVINGNGLAIGGDKFVVSVDQNKNVHVSVKGHVEAESGTFKGRVEATDGIFYGSVAVPPQEIPDNTLPLTLSFQNGFNFSGMLSYASKTIYLPTSIDYVGVECSIINYGGTSNGYYQIKAANGYSFLYSGTPKNRNTVNYIKLYGTSQLKLKAIKVSGVVRWFIDNYTDFSYDFINKCLTNNLANQMARCIGAYNLTSTTSLQTLSCADGNQVTMSRRDKGRWTFYFKQARSANKSYAVVVNGSTSIYVPIIHDKTNSSFQIDLVYYLMGAENWGDIANWGFIIFEFDT